MQTENMEPSKIAKILVKSVSTGEMVAVETFWKDSSVVLIFLRRFGCQLCRLGAQQISQLKPLLNANNVTLVGVGLEELGVEEFVQGNYFAGDLYIDLKKECYKTLGFRRLNFFTMIPALFGKKTRKTIAETREKNVGGNFAGDGWQSGGALVITKDGKTLFTFRQETPGEHMDPNDVLKALGIEGAVDVKHDDVPQCNDAEACALPKKPVAVVSD